MENKLEHTVRIEPAGIERRVPHGTSLGRLSASRAWTLPAADEVSAASAGWNC